MVDQEMKMKCVSVTSELLVIQRKRFNNNRNAYRLDLWQEMKKRWMVFAVLITVMMATITPRLGAPGGRLHLEYVSYVPLSYIYYSAGQRPACEPITHWTLLVAVVNTHIVSPALCILTISTFRESLDYRILEGALATALGGGCPWLALALCECGAALPAVAAAAAAALLAAPLHSLLMCGSFRPSLQSAVALLSAAAPYCAGACRARAAGGRRRLGARLAALLLLYADCCRRLSDAEGSLDVGHVLGTLMLVACWLAAAAAGGALLARAQPRHAHALRAAALKGWEFSSTCPTVGLAALPGVFLAPAQALLLAAAPCPAQLAAQGPRPAPASRTNHRPGYTADSTNVYR